MYYKVMKNGKAIDALDRLAFVKYHPKYSIMINCSEDDAQGIISSDGRYIWHVNGYYNIPTDGYDSVSIEPINQYEYYQIKSLNGKTPEEIIDAYTLSLIQGGIL